MDQEEYERIVNTYADIIYRVALSYTKSKEDAEDVVQTTFMKLFTKPAHFQDEDHVRKWLIRVAVNECNGLWSSFWRKHVDYVEHLEEAPAFSKEEYTDLYEAVQLLSPKLRIIVHLFYYEGYSSKEIAKLLSIREATVRTRLVRARRLLKLELGDDESQSPAGETGSICRIKEMFVNEEAGTI